MASRTKKQETSEAEVEAIEQARPLSATASRALQKLIDNDFDNVKAEIIAYAEEVQDRRTEEVKAEWVEKTAAAEQFRIRAQELVDNYIRETDALKNIARMASVAVYIPNFRSGYSRNDTEVSVDVVGLDTAIGEVVRLTNREKNRALAALERERNTAQRKVLLATITTEAEAVLGQIPNAADMFRQATAQQAVTV